jgi:hypothetical protein
MLALYYDPANRSISGDPWLIGRSHWQQVPLIINDSQRFQQVTRVHLWQDDIYTRGLLGSVYEICPGCATT